jgi:hypothetical protein
MHQEQSVSEMVEEVLERQAQHLADRSGTALQEAHLELRAPRQVDNSKSCAKANTATRRCATGKPTSCLSVPASVLGKGERPRESPGDTLRDRRLGAGSGRCSRMRTASYLLPRSYSCSV